MPLVCRDKIYSFSVSSMSFFSYRTILMFSLKATLLAICLMSTSGCNRNPVAPPEKPSISTTQDEQAIRSLIENWVRVGLDSKNNSQEEVAELYDNTSDDVVLYNNDDPQRQIRKSVEEYSKFWSNFLQNNEILDKELREIHQVVVEGDLATSVFETELTVTGGRGKATHTSLVTLVWRRTPDGWRIIHEHSSDLNTASENAQNQATKPLQLGVYRFNNNYLSVFQKGGRICINTSSVNGSIVASVHVDPNNSDLYQVGQNSDRKLMQVTSNTISYLGYDYIREESMGIRTELNDVEEKCLDSTINFFELIPPENEG